MVLIISPEQITSTTLHIATDADDIRNHVHDTTVRIQEYNVITLCKKHRVCEDQDGLLFTRLSYPVPDLSGLLQPPLLQLLPSPSFSFISLVSDFLLRVRPSTHCLPLSPYVQTSL